MFIDLLANVQFRLAEEQVKNETQEKVWISKYMWYINPSLQCPYCQKWLSTERVWVVDEEERKVRRLFLVQGGYRIDLEGCHPHVGAAGRICMGSARTPVEALFAGLSDDAYTKPYDWLPEVLGHECDELMDARDEAYIYCAACDERVSEDDIYRSDNGDCYCSDCYYDNHWFCYRCGESWHVESDEIRNVVDGDYYCESCFDRDFFDCEGCGDNFRKEEYGGDGRCEACYDELWECCSECGADFERTDNALDEEGRCEDCRPKEEQDAESESY